MLHKVASARVLKMLFRRFPVPDLNTLSRPSQRLILQKCRKRLISFGAPGATRTHDSQIRNLVLYPPELRGQCVPFTTTVTDVK